MQNSVAISGDCLPTYIVSGSNWTADVQLDAYNAQFSVEDQKLEAATKAIEAFKGIDNGIFISLNPGEEQPFISTTLVISGEGLKTRDVILTHELLANAGFYKDSFEAQTLLNHQIKDIQEGE